ncbi:helix-turn-helix domain-containing protein [Clostridium sp. MCC353]|uniref:PucR family transcriptional regulator n=1 Tax=Clostridium sp. MCC353 TaxID=2592646 RepID=UPI001C01E28D|nr:helix-turn-helix domain-containing protein [Clostridium sp. MCC353]
MLTTSILLHPLAPYILISSIPHSSLESVQSILLLNGQMDLDCRNIYIGTPDAILHALDHASFSGSVTLLCAAGNDCRSLPDLPMGDYNLVILSLDFIDLYNRTAQSLNAYRNWLSRLEQAVKQNADLKIITDLGYEMLRYPILILNNAYKVIAKSHIRQFYDFCLHEADTSDYLCYETIQTIHKETVLNTSFNSVHREYISSYDKHYTVVRLVRYKGMVAARVSVTMPNDQPNPFITDLSADFVSYIEEYMIHNDQLGYRVANEFSTLVADLLDQRLTSPAELEQRLKMMPALAFQKYYHIIVITFEQTQENIPWNFIINQLEQVLPSSNMAVYHRELIILTKKAHHQQTLSFDHDKFSAILQNYRAYAAIGNYSKFLISLHSLYVQTKSALPLGMVFRESEDERIFLYEKYSIYHMVSLCADAFYNTYHNRNLIYLCHPALIALERYDKKYGNNLKDVLYLYLTNDRNSAKTAKDLFIHRNTMLYKINKIEEIIGQSLDDHLLRERLLFSFHILEYVDKMLHQDPLVLKQDEKRPESTSKEKQS